MTPTERMLIILRMLRAADDQEMSSQAFWDGIDDYAGGDLAQRRKWRNDADALQRRGLIEYGFTSRVNPQRTAVRLRRLKKPRDLELSEREHAALRQARELVAVTGIAVTEGREGRGAEDLDVLMDALRELEEHEDEMPLLELAALLSVDARHLRRVLQRAWLLTYGEAHATVIDEMKFVGISEDVADDGEDVPLADADVRVGIVRSTDPRRPVAGRGLDLLGRFAYTLAETQQRLAAADAALAAPSRSLDVPALRTARVKLARWADVLSEERSPDKIMS